MKDLPDPQPSTFNPQPCARHPKPKTLKYQVHVSAMQRALAAAPPGALARSTLNPKP
jgi:hypothetical protein